MLSRIRSALGLGSPAAKPAKPAQPRHIRAGYDALQDGIKDAKHWSNADLLSVNAGMTAGIRQKARSRSRYEYANNGYAKGMVNTLANDVVGIGPRLQVTTDDPKVNDRIEKAWRAWSHSIRLAAKLRTMRVGKAVDGEAFAILATNSALTGEIKLDIRLVEPEQVATPGVIISDSSKVDGIKFDDFGNPTSYTVLSSHPGDNVMMSMTGKDFPAKDVIHYFTADRAGQARGLPDILPSLPIFAQLRRWTMATLTSAETAANLSGVMHTDTPPGGEAEAITEFETVEIEQGSVMTLPSGWDFKQIDGKHPTTMYAEFKRQLINEAGRPLQMPLNIALGDSSGYNYASGRLDHQTYAKMVRTDRDEIELAILDRILAAFLAELVLRDTSVRSVYGSINPTLPSHQWFWSGSEHVDPAKEADAQATRLASNTTTLAAEYAKQGLDWEKQLEQRAKEIKLMRDLKLPAPPAGDGTKAVPTSGGSEEETSD